MIYTLKYVSHPIERVNQVVYEFLKNSIPDGVYTHDLFPEWFRDVLINSLIFNNEFEDAYNEIQKLTIAKRTELFSEFQDGIDIISLCSDTTKPVVLSEAYSQTLHNALNLLLKDRFYGSSLGTNITLQTKLGTTLRKHYHEFKNTNNKGRVCPFCGLYEYSLLEGESKDDYDHWLYKAKYPIYAVNFSNLVPMCGKCNQTGVKGTADVLHNPETGLRRKFFYPYQENSGVNIRVSSFKSPEMLTVEEKKKYPSGYFNIEVNPIAIGEADEVEGWKDVFKIEKRFNSYLSTNYNQLSEEFFDTYLPDHPEFVINEDEINLRNIVERFKNQLGNPIRRTGVEIGKAYLDFICQPANTYLLYSFFKIKLAA